MKFCGGVEAYNERSLCVKYRSQWVQTYFYEFTPSAQGPLADTTSQRLTEDSGNARANIPNASKERNLRDTSGYSRVLFECIPGTQGFWRVASSNRLKPTERPHRRSSLSHAHYKLSAEYHRKSRLCIQNRSARCVLSCTNTSRQQEVPSFCLPKQGTGITIPSTFLWSEHCPSGILLVWGSLPSSSRDIGHPISRRLVDTPPRQ